MAPPRISFQNGRAGHQGGGGIDGRRIGDGAENYDVNRETALRWGEEKQDSKQQ